MWVELNARPCARDDAGQVACWGSEDWSELSYTGHEDGWTVAPHGPLREISVGHEVWGVREDGVAEAVIPSAELAPPLPAPVGLADITRHCGRLGSQIVCWGPTPSPFPSDREYLRLGGDGVMHAAWTTTGELIWRHLTLPELGGELAIPVGRTVVALAAAVGGACALLDDQTVLCSELYAHLFLAPPYAQIAAHGNVMCAAFESGHVRCSDAPTYDWGPLRELAVFTEPMAPGNGSGVCGITVDNAIRCDGPRYDFPDLQASLPTGD